MHLLDVLGADAACIGDGVALTPASWIGDDLIVCVDRDQADAVLLGDLPHPRHPTAAARPADEPGTPKEPPVSLRSDARDIGTASRLRAATRRRGPAPTATYATLVAPLPGREHVP